MQDIDVNAVSDAVDNYVTQCDSGIVYELARIYLLDHYIQEASVDEVSKFLEEWKDE